MPGNPRQECNTNVEVVLSSRQWKINDKLRLESAYVLIANASPAGETDENPS